MKNILKIILFFFVACLITSCATTKKDTSVHGTEPLIDTTKVKEQAAKDMTRIEEAGPEGYDQDEEVVIEKREKITTELTRSYEFITDEYSDLKQIIASTIGGKIISEFENPAFNSGDILATRKAFGAVLDLISGSLPQLVGGSADLEPSNYTGNFAKTYGDFQKTNKSGRNIPFGVREFPMAAIMNGMALHGGIIPFGGTFLVFSDYERPALRLAAIQKVRVIHEFTHDSFYLGEDGPTHQPIEHIMSLRAIPHFKVYRPADAKETASCVKLAIEDKNTPSALLLTRQGVPILTNGQKQTDINVSKGAYSVIDCKGLPEIIILATGSEVSLAIEVAKNLRTKKVRVVSMPCWEIFNDQTNEYKKELIPDRGNLKVSIEAGITNGWEKYIGNNGLAIGINHFGSSAPATDLAIEFGFTPDQVTNKIEKYLKELL